MMLGRVFGPLFIYFSKGCVLEFAPGEGHKRPSHMKRSQINLLSGMHRLMLSFTHTITRRHRHTHTLMCTTNLSDVPVEIWEDKTVRFCEGYAGIKITNGKLICNTRLRRQLLKKASCVLHCYAGFIFPLKRYWYLTPHHRRHPPQTRTHALVQPCRLFHVHRVFSVFSTSERAPACASHGCHYNCAVTHDGPQCYCNSGYEVAADGKMCKGERGIYCRFIHAETV